jgi:AraC-like DNA-binding protein
MRRLLFSELFKKYLVSYIIVIAVIVGLVGLVLIEAISGTIEKEMSDINFKRISYINSIIEKSVLESAESLVHGQIMSAQLINLSGTYAHLELHKYLKSQLVAKPFIKSVNVYYPAEHTLVSSEGVKYGIDGIDGQPAIGAILQENSPSAAYWSKADKETVGPADSKGAGIITYARPSTVKSGQTPLFILYVNVYEDYIRNMLTVQLINDKESIFILDEHYRIVSQATSAEFPLNEQIGIDFTDMLKDSANHLAMKKVNGSDIMLLSHYSPYNHWHYVLIMPLTDFFRVSFYIRNTILVVSASALLLGLLLSLFMSLNQYKPVRRIVANLRQNPETMPPMGNEYTFIQDSIKELHLSVVALKVKVNESNLNRLLRGILGSPSDREMDALMPCGRFITAAYRIHGSDPDEALFLRMEAELCQTPFSDSRVFLTSYSRDTIVAVFNFNGVDEPILRHIRQASQTMADSYPFPLRCGVGPAVYDAAELHMSCEGAVRALNHHFIAKESSAFICSRDIHSLDDFSLAGEYYNLMQAFDTNSMVEINRIFSGISNTLARKLYRYESVEHAVYQIIPLVTKKMMEAEPAQRQRMLNDNNVAVEFFRKGTIFKALAWLEEIAASILSLRTEENSSLVLIQSVKSYIDDNYGNEISLELLSQKTFISSSYISQLFKKTFGIGVSDYVSQVRLEKAKRLLEDENLKIEEIAELVGMSNSTYFITKFKRKYGVTPNQHRLQHKARQLGD